MEETNTNKQARLDFFFISECLFTDVDDSIILPGYKTDHSLVIFKFDLGKFEKERSLEI